MKIYVASSWRNNYQPNVIKILREEGYDVYDFKDSKGFGWKEVDPEYSNWLTDIARYLRGLMHPRVIEGFNRDFEHIKNCDVCIMVMPCGLSAGLELGWASGNGKKTAVYIPRLREPELMIKVADVITTEMSDICDWLKTLNNTVDRTSWDNHQILNEALKDC